MCKWLHKIGIPWQVCCILKVTNAPSKLLWFRELSLWSTGSYITSAAWQRCLCEDGEWSWKVFACFFPGTPTLSDGNAAVIVGPLNGRIHKHVSDRFADLKWLAIIICWKILKLSSIGVSAIRVGENNQDSYQSVCDGKCWFGIKGFLADSSFTCVTLYINCFVSVCVPWACYHNPWRRVFHRHSVWKTLHWLQSMKPVVFQNGSFIVVFHQVPIVWPNSSLFLEAIGETNSDLPLGI